MASSPVRKGALAARNFVCSPADRRRGSVTLRVFFWSALGGVACEKKRKEEQKKQKKKQAVTRRERERALKIHPCMHACMHACARFANRDGKQQGDKNPTTFTPLVLRTKPDQKLRHTSDVRGVRSPSASASNSVLLLANNGLRGFRKLSGGRMSS